MGDSHLTIALTGAIGSGKSRVADLFRQQGVRVVDADEISRGLLEPEAEGWSGLQEVFGARFLGTDGRVDRKKLREAIFGDAALRKTVNAILHPLIRKKIKAICAEQLVLDGIHPENERRMTIIEVPLLFEAGWQDDFDIVVVVTADVKTCLARVMERDGVDLPSATASFSAQLSLAEKVGMADYVIDNNGMVAETSRQVRDLYLKLIG